MSIVSKILRGVAVATAHTIARPLLSKDDMAWIKKHAEQERQEEKAAKATKKSRPR